MPPFVTGEDLLADPNYPAIPHIPIERLRLDPTCLPPQRRKADGTPVCLAGDHPVIGDRLLCGACKAESRNASQRRRRAALKPDEAISKKTLSRIHDRVDSLGPLINDLSVAYNNGGDLRDEMHRVMLAVKTLEREVRTLLPDPREP